MCILALRAGIGSVDAETLAQEYALETLRSTHNPLCHDEGSGERVMEPMGAFVPESCTFRWGISYIRAARGRTLARYAGTRASYRLGLGARSHARSLPVCSR